MTYCGGCSKLVTANRSRTPELTPVVSGVRIARSLVFCVVFYRSLFVLLSFFLLDIALYALLKLQLQVTLSVYSNSSRRLTTSI